MKAELGHEDHRCSVSDEWAMDEKKLVDYCVRMEMERNVCSKKNLTQGEKMKMLIKCYETKAIFEMDATAGDDQSINNVLKKKLFKKYSP